VESYQARKEPHKVREVALVCVRVLLAIPWLIGPVRDRLTSAFVRRQALESHPCVKRVFDLKDDKISELLIINLTQCRIFDEVDPEMFSGESAWLDHSLSVEDG